MITIHMMGGLGNQMFQYAAARSLSRRLQTGLQLDVSNYFSPEPRMVGFPGHPRPFDLGRLDLADHERLSGWRALPVRAIFALAEHVPRRTAERLLGVYGDADLRGWSACARKDARLRGYFQNERFFADVAPLIRREFRLRDATLARHVAGCVSRMRRHPRALISIHVRRGDYLLVRPDGELLVPIEKIRAAMARFEGADFVVFSDDLAWCRDHLDAPGVQFSPFGSAVEDLMAMSLCDHNIIANSTFSWWAAWLNPNPQKQVLVLAPGDDRRQEPTSRHPLGWLKI